MPKTQKRNIRNKKRKSKRYKKSSLRRKIRGGKRKFTKNKSYKRKTRQNKKRQRRKTLRRKNKMIGGGCDSCQYNNNNTIMQGGAKIPMYKYNTNPFLPDMNTPCLNAPTPYKGGRKRKNKLGKKSKKYKQNGGGMSSILSNVLPGYNNVRDLYWKGGEVAKGIFNQYNGNEWGTNTSAGVQPISKVAMNNSSPLDLPKMIHDSGTSAAKFSPVQK